MKKNKKFREIFRLTEEEYKELMTEMMDTPFRSKSEFYRYKLFIKLDYDKESIKGESLSREVAKANFEINKIGNNINQLAKSVNSRQMDATEAIKIANEKLTKIVELINRLEK